MRSFISWTARKGGDDDLMNKGLGTVVPFELASPARMRVSVGAMNLADKCVCVFGSTQLSVQVRSMPALMHWEVRRSQLLLALLGTGERTFVTTLAWRVSWSFDRPSLAVRDRPQAAVSGIVAWGVAFNKCARWLGCGIATAPFRRSETNRSKAS